MQSATQCLVKAQTMPKRRGCRLRAKGGAAEGFPAVADVPAQARPVEKNGGHPLPGATPRPGMLSKPLARRWRARSLQIACTKGTTSDVAGVSAFISPRTAPSWLMPSWLLTARIYLFASTHLFICISAFISPRTAPSWLMPAWLTAPRGPLRAATSRSSICTTTAPQATAAGQPAIRPGKAETS